jgi:hypothetical protein
MIIFGWHISFFRARAYTLRRPYFHGRYYCGDLHCISLGPIGVRASQLRGDLPEPQA